MSMNVRDGVLKIAGIDGTTALEITIRELINAEDIFKSIASHNEVVIDSVCNENEKYIQVALSGCRYTAVKLDHLKIRAKYLIKKDSKGNKVIAPVWVNGFDMTKNWVPDEGELYAIVRSSDEIIQKNLYSLFRDIQILLSLNGSLYSLPLKNQGKYGLFCTGDADTGINCNKIDGVRKLIDNVNDAPYNTDLGQGFEHECQDLIRFDINTGEQLKPSFNWKSILIEVTDDYFIAPDSVKKFIKR